MLTDEAVTPPPKVTGSPPEIWLVYGDLESDATHADVMREHGDVLWCEDQQHGTDVRYVRADLVWSRESWAVSRPPQGPVVQLGLMAPPALWRHFGDVISLQARITALEAENARLNAYIAGCY